MKNATLSLIMIMSLLGPAAFAQGTSNTKSPDTRPSPFMVSGFNVGFEYMSPNSSVADIKNKATGNVERGFKNDLALVPKQLGIKAGYKQITRGGFGFDLNLSILKADQRIENTSDLTTIMPSANFIIAAPDYVYGALGLNTAIVAGDENAKHNPRIGYQVGGGVILKKNLNVEVFYNWIHQGLEYQQALTEERVTSTNARLIYAF